MTAGYGTGSDARKRLAEARTLDQAFENCGLVITSVALGDLTEGDRPSETACDGSQGMSSEIGRHTIDGMGSE